VKDGLATRLFVDSSRYLRGPWRLGIFVVLVVLLTIALRELAFGVWGVPDDDSSLAVVVAIMLPAALLASWTVMARLERLPMLALGLQWNPVGARSFLSGSLLGILLIGSVVALLAVLGWLRWTPAAGDAADYATTALWLGVLIAGAAWTEELLFRGYPLQVLAQTTGFPFGIGVTAVVFSVAHLGNPGAAPLAMVNITLSGVLLGVAYWRTYSLWYVTGVHFGWNWSMSLADLSVSGMPTGMPAVDPLLQGPDLWTGGSFGPEGGVLVTLVTAAGIGWIWRTRRLTRSLEIQATGPLPERRPSAA
jgi:membrane protease YdiL (CAAX protease family)